MKSPKIKSSKMSGDTLYVPFYLRHFNVSEKIIIALSIFISSMAVSSIPLVFITLSSPRTPEPTPTKTYSGEAQLWKTLGEKN